MEESKSSSTKVGLSVFLVAGSTAAVTVILTSDLTTHGRHVYDLLERADEDPAGGGMHPYQVSLAICLLLIFWGYLVDMHLWKSAWRPLVNGYSGVLGLFFLAAVMLYSSEAPSIPLLVGIGVGLWLVHSLRVKGFPHVPAEEFSYCAGAAYAVTGQLTIVVWLCWAFTPWMGFHNRDWEEAARPSLETENFVRWCSPLLLALVYVLIALFLRWRSRMLTQNDYVLAELKLICSTFVLLFLFSWLAASIASGDAGLAKVVLRLSVLLSAGAAVYLVTTLGPETILSACEQNKTLSLLTSLLTGDWVKGAFVLVCLPLMPVCIAIEMVHNVCRRAVRRCVLTDREPGLWITEEAARLLEWTRTWHISSVLVKAMWVGIIYFILQVGCGRGIVVLLAWVCEKSLHLSWFGVVAILYCLGAFLFLLPPVPGYPIYMVSSVLITKRMESTGGHFLLASLFALVVSMVIKLSAVAMQQKLIGERFSDSISVKKLVSIHTPEMKAIRHILSQRGLHADKMDTPMRGSVARASSDIGGRQQAAQVIVLVCGPDWPTSVLTGVLKLPVFDMLLGTLPMVFLILPFTLAGSFIVHASTLPDNTMEKRRFEGLSSALLFLSMLSQMGGMILIFQCTHGIIERFKDQLADGWMKDCQEEEVLKEIEQEDEQTQLRQESTRWTVLPWWVRANLMLGTALMSIMLHIIILPFMKPFRDFSLEDKFSDIEGVYFLIHKSGWVAIACLCCSVACLSVFELWCARAMRESGELKPLRPASAGSYGGGSA